MFKKTIKFKDFNDKDQEQDFYFHLSNTQLAALAAGADSMQLRIKRIMDAKDNLAILTELRKLVEMSCGVRSDDGARFIKTDEAKSQLLDSPAYDVLLFELFLGNNAVEFFQKLVPENQQNEIQALVDAQKANPFKEPEASQPAWIKEDREPTAAELRTMSPEQLQAAFRARMTPKE